MSLDWFRRSPVVVVLALVVAVLTVPPGQQALADTSPPDVTTPKTVSSDPLPTVQINGVVWTQKVAAGKVFAGGQFTKARPAGAAAGTNQTTRTNLLAYDLATGKLIDAIVLNTNGQVLGSALSPDGTRLYMGGDFTTVNGVTHNHVVAINTADGTVDQSFKAATNARVEALAATASTVYVGGKFGSAGSGQARGSLAAFNAASGALLNWAPKIGGNSARVNSMTMNPSRTKVIAGGSFTTMNSSTQLGMAALDPVSGTVLPWPVNTVVKNYDANSAILSLAADDTSVYGAGYTFGSPGNLEGTFKADGETGQLQWVEDCHGDSYDVWPLGDALYAVGHPHFCGNVGSFPQTNPWTFHRALAFSKTTTGTITKDMLGYPNWQGKPAPTALHWFPEVPAGTYTGISQGPWSLSGNDQYLVMGGEFPKVNGVGQQGLARFAISSVAPNKQGPWLKGANFKPTVSELPGGGVSGVSLGNWDTDSELLTYKVVRNGDTAHPIADITRRSSFFRQPTIGFVDTNVTAGQTYTYRVYASDSYGNTTSGDAASITATKNGAEVPAYVRAVLESGASLYWRLNETSGNALDWAGSADGLRGGGVAGNQPGALLTDGNASSSFDGTSNGRVSSPSGIVPPQGFSVESWFKTTTGTGGKIIGFGNAATGVSSVHDRTIYMRNDGKLVLGIFNGVATTLVTPGAYNDGQWHQVVGSVGAEGMRLYVDGQLVASNTTGRTERNYTGFWRVGGDGLGGWPNQPSSVWFKGQIDEFAVYGQALSAAEVLDHYAKSGR